MVLPSWFVDEVAFVVDGGLLSGARGLESRTDHVVDDLLLLRAERVVDVLDSCVGTERVVSGSKSRVDPTASRAAPIM
jgi:hypothetical protein